MINIYTVQCETDMTEGRGGKRDVISFMSEDEAWSYANKQLGIMGRKPTDGDWRTYSGGSDWNVKSTQVWERNEYSEETIKRNKALAKLTPEEKKLLGLS